MLATLFASLLTVLATVTEPGVPTTSERPQPISASSAAIAERAKTLLSQIQDGKLDRATLTPEFSSEFTDAAVAADAGFLAGRGKPARLGLLQHSETDSGERYVFYVAWSAGAVAYTLGIDKTTGLIDACYFRAAAGAATSP